MRGKGLQQEAQTKHYKETDSSIAQVELSEPALSALGCLEYLPLTPHTSTHIYKCTSL